MAQFFKDLKSYFEKVSNRRFLAKFEDKRYLLHCGDENRVRWFEIANYEDRIEAMEKGYLRAPSTLELLFPNYANLVAPYMSLDTLRFAVILKEGYMRALEGYLNKYGTLSTQKVYALIEAMVNRAGKDAPMPISEESKRLPALVYRYIVREGIQVTIVQDVKKLVASDENLAALVDKAIDIHYHIMEVKNGMNDNRDCVNSNFLSYLDDLKKKNIQMPYEAEILMNGIQVKYFHYKGLHLSKEAIVTLLTYDQHGTTTECILKNEPLSPMWKELEYVLKGNIDLYHRYRSADQAGNLLQDESVA